MFGVGTGEIPGQIEVDSLIAEARGAKKVAQSLPVLRNPARFLLQLSLCGALRRFRYVYLARGQFPQPATGGMPVLAQQANPVFVIQCHNGRAARMTHDFQLHCLPIRQRNAFQSQVDDLTFIEGFPVFHPMSLMTVYSQCLSCAVG